MQRQVAHHAAHHALAAVPQQRSDKPRGKWNEAWKEKLALLRDREPVELCAAGAVQHLEERAGKVAAARAGAAAAVEMQRSRHVSLLHHASYGGQHVAERDVQHVPRLQAVDELRGGVPHVAYYGSGRAQ